MNEETFVSALPADQFRAAVETALVAVEWSQDQSRLTWAWFPLPNAELETLRYGRIYMVLSAEVGPYHIVWLEADRPRRRVLLDVQRGAGVEAEYLLDLFEDWAAAQNEEEVAK